MILTNHGMLLYKVLLKAKATALFSRWAHAVPSMYGARPSAQSRAKAWTVNTHTSTPAHQGARSFYVLWGWVRGGQSREERTTRKTLNRAKILFTDIRNHRRGDTHVMGDACDDGPIKVQDWIQKQLVSKCVKVCGTLACVYGPSCQSWLYVHQKQQSKINHAKFSPCKGTVSIPLADILAGNNPTAL